MRGDFLGSDKMKTLRLFAFAVLVALLVPGIAYAQKAPKDAAAKTKLEKATFAGGCFWSMQVPFDKVKGVTKTVVGFSGGTEKNPSYAKVSLGRTGHAESIEITYDPAQITFEQLLEIYWHNIDPTQDNGQFADIGPQYNTYIFFHDEEQRKIAESSRERLAKSGRFARPIAVKIAAATAFWPAEEEHQKYGKKNPDHYYRYAEGSGRYPFIRRAWGIDPQK